MVITLNSLYFSIIYQHLTLKIRFFPREELIQPPRNYTTVCNHLFFSLSLSLYSTFISITVLTVSDFSPHNMPKPPHSVLSHLVHHRRHAHVSSHIFIPYPIFFRHSTHQSKHYYHHYYLLASLFPLTGNRVTLVLCSISLSTAQHSESHKYTY